MLKVISRVSFQKSSTVQIGGVELSVVHEIGKEGVQALLGPGDFFGEGGMGGQTVRIGTATAITPTTLLVIEKNEMIRVLHAEHAFSNRFLSYMLSCCINNCYSRPALCMAVLC